MKRKEKEHLKAASCSLIALASVLFGLASTSNAVYADNAQMVNLPKATQAKGNLKPREYSFSARITSNSRVIPFGGGEEDWGTAKTNTESHDHYWYCFQLSSDTGNNNKWKGKVGVYYSNVGVYKGHIVDIKITMMDWKVKNYRWEDTNNNGVADTKVPIKTAYAAFGRNDFDIFTPGMGAVKYRLDYYDHNSHKPIKMTAAWDFDDIDGNQWVGIEPSTWSNIDQIFYGNQQTGETWLSSKKMGGMNYIYSDANQHNTEIKAGGKNEGTVLSTDLKGGFTTTFSSASSYIINWVFGQNTGKHAIDEQNQLEHDDTYWNMVGKYDATADTKYSHKNMDFSYSVPHDLFNHAYLQYGTNAILPDKPKEPQKFVSDSDEGTNTINEVGTDKSVDHDILKNRYEKYHYQITHDVPGVRSEFKYTSYQITDDLDNDLDISNVHVYNAENQDVTYMFTTNVGSGNNLSVVAKGDTLKNDDFYRQQYKVTFDAKVKPGVSLADHKDPKHKDQAVFYNTAEVTTSNGSADSNKTTTNIPFTPKEQTKAVSTDGNGKGDSIEVDYGQEYKYSVDIAVPDDENVKSIELKDKLEDVLELKDVKVYDRDDSNKNITSEGKLTKTGNTVDWTATDASKWHGKHLRMIITASVKNSPNLMKYLDKNSKIIKVPNKAIWLINGKDDATNTVYVTPKGPKASVDKWIELPDIK